MTRFRNRSQAGELLARQLREYAGRSDVVVLALPRGGVPVAFEVATALDLTLDVFTVRKIGAPRNVELAIGAIASGGVCMLNEDIIRELHVQDADIDRTIDAERRELGRRERLYRGGRPFPDLTNRTVILVDDGVASGATMRTAVEALRTHHPSSVVAAVPVASREACDMLVGAGARCVSVIMPEPMYGVGEWYDDFSQTSDEEVLALLERAHASDDRLEMRESQAADPHDPR